MKSELRWWLFLIYCAGANWAWVTKYGGPIDWAMAIIGVFVTIAVIYEPNWLFTRDQPF